MVTESQRVQVGRDLKANLIPTLLPWAGKLALGQAAPIIPTRPGTECPVPHQHSSAVGCAEIQRGEAFPKHRVVPSIAESTVTNTTEQHPQTQETHENRAVTPTVLIPALPETLHSSQGRPGLNQGTALPTHTLPGNAGVLPIRGGLWAPH